MVVQILQHSARCETV
uniref:Uncharacterized protein n=1 Tax=Arundo donax TaxID=35708 RepID=A0A0A8YM65_ARUDO